MITVQPFSIEAIKTHGGFYRLSSIRNVSELQILHNTPAGHIETDVADAFSMRDGSIVIAWQHALKLSPMHNLVAVSGQTTENINLIPLERVIDIYDRPIDAQVGVFSFTNSDMILAPNLDWRCDNGKFGPRSFHPITIMDDLPQIVMYEPVLSVNGVGYIIYIEGVGKQTLAEHHLNADEYPVTGRTLWETLKLVREWAVVNEQPFNNQDAVSLKAKLFCAEMDFNSQELSVIDNQAPMQIANYLSGNNNARQRPSNVLPINDDVKHLLFKRLASGSMSALEYLNPGMWDLQELIDIENQHLVLEITMFEKSKTVMDPNKPVIPIQDRFFANKKIILDKVALGQL